MRRALIPALLIASSAFAPYLRAAIQVPYPPSDLESVARPLFWRAWDVLLTRELSMVIKSPQQSSEEPAWRPPSQSDALVCILFQILLKHAFDNSLPAAEKKFGATVSISQNVVRRVSGADIYSRSEAMCATLNPDVRRATHEIPEYL
jgi:hypothetical protein